MKIIAVDIGGTFTDVIISDTNKNKIYEIKTLTTTNDPFIGLNNALIEANLKYLIDLTNTKIVIHGTTIVTNALLENQLERCAIITTKGFKDILEIGRHFREETYSLQPKSISSSVERYDRFEIDERVTANGNVLVPINKNKLIKIGKIINKRKIKTVAICFLHSYSNNVNEKNAALILKKLYPKLKITISSDIIPEIREYERFSTTVINAQLCYKIENYLKYLNKKIKTITPKCKLYLAQSNSGVCEPRIASSFPIKLLLSGPSGGASASIRISKLLKEPNLIAIDMGGTSFEVILITDGSITYTSENVINGYPIKLTMVEMHTIGAGGGSISKIDNDGLITVGPQSSGSYPGPICYDWGGNEITVTDANFILGRIDSENFFNGNLKLNLNKTKNIFKKKFSELNNFSLEESAQGIINITNSNLANSIRLSLYKKGLDPHDYTIISYGGASGLHAVEVAEEIGVNKIIFPFLSSSFSALGLMWSDILHNFVVSIPSMLNNKSISLIKKKQKSLEIQANKMLEKDGIGIINRSFEYLIDLRYKGQAYELSVGIDINELLNDNFVAQLSNIFHLQHRNTYSYSDDTCEIEIVAMRLNAKGTFNQNKKFITSNNNGLELVKYKKIHTRGRWYNCPIYNVKSKISTKIVKGIALIELGYTNIFVAKNWDIRIDKNNNLIANRIKKHV